MREDEDPASEITIDLCCTVGDSVDYLKLFNRPGFFFPAAQSETFYLRAIRGGRAGATVTILAPGADLPSVLDIQDIRELATKASAEESRLLGVICIAMTGTGCRLVFLPSWQGDHEHYNRVCQVISKQLHDGGLVVTPADTPGGGRRRDPDYEWAASLNC